MTRKDYKLIASVMHNLRVMHNSGVEGEHYSYVLTHYAECLADRLEADNPLFDRSKFLEASGVQTLSGVAS